MADNIATAKDFFAQCLSGDSGHVLALREEHDATAHTNLITTLLPELRSKHHLRTIGMEYNPYMMLFFWAHRDGHIDDKQLLEAMKGYASDSRYHEAAKSKTNMIDKAHSEAKLIASSHRQQDNVRITGFDTRGFLDQKVAIWEQAVGNPPDPTRKGAKAAKSAATVYWAKKLYDQHPHYAALLDVIEHAIIEIQNVRVKNLKGEDVPIPDDTISAMVASAMAKPGGNMITISGAAHLRGESSDLHQVDGIFDEALAEQNWQVTDAWMATEKDINRKIQELSNPVIQHIHQTYLCGNYDSMDALYVLGENGVADRVIRFPRTPNLISDDPVEQLGNDLFSCVSSPSPDTIFSEEQLAPQNIPAVKAALENIQVAMEAASIHRAGEKRATLPRNDAQSHKTIARLLKNAKGLGVGDHHNETHITNFMIHAMPTFAKEGVKHLYLEAGKEWDRQLFEDFFAHKDGSEDTLREALKLGWGDDMGWKPHEVGVTMKLIKAARAAGIKVLPIDYDRKGHDTADDNKVWIQTIQNDYLPQLGSDDKYVVLAGQRHFEGEKNDLDTLLNIPTLGYNNLNIRTSFRRGSQIKTNPQGSQTSHQLVLTRSTTDVLKEELARLKRDTHPANALVNLYQAAGKRLRIAIANCDALYEELAEPNPNPVIAQELHERVKDALDMYTSADRTKRMVNTILDANRDALSIYLATQAVGTDKSKGR